MCIDDLEKLYDVTISAIWPSDVSYFHLRSVENFINSIHRIDDAIVREEICEALTKYLNEVQLLRYSEKMTMADRVNFFNKHIHAIGKIYVQKLSFGIYIKPWFFASWVVMGNATCFVLGNVIWFYILFNLVIVGYYADSLIKKYKGQVYGFDY